MALAELFEVACSCGIDVAPNTDTGQDASRCGLTIGDEPRQASHDAPSERRGARAARRGVGSIAWLAGPSPNVISAQGFLSPVRTRKWSVPTGGQTDH